MRSAPRREILEELDMQECKPVSMPGVDEPLKRSPEDEEAGCVVLDPAMYPAPGADSASKLHCSQQGGNLVCRQRAPPMHALAHGLRLEQAKAPGQISPAGLGRSPSSRGNSAQKYST